MTRSRQDGSFAIVLERKEHMRHMLGIGWDNLVDNNWVEGAANQKSPER
jgi:hypothetical protein